MDNSISGQCAILLLDPSCHYYNSKCQQKSDEVNHTPSLMVEPANTIAGKNSISRNWLDYTIGCKQILLAEVIGGQSWLGRTKHLKMTLENHDKHKKTRTHTSD